MNYLKVAVILLLSPLIIIESIDFWHWVESYFNTRIQDQLFVILTIISTVLFFPFLATFVALINFLIKRFLGVHLLLGEFSILKTKPYFYEKEVEGKVRQDISEKQIKKAVFALLNKTAGLNYSLALIRVISPTPDLNKELILLQGKNECHLNHFVLIDIIKQYTQTYKISVKEIFKGKLFFKNSLNSLFHLKMREDIKLSYVPEIERFLLSKFPSDD